MERRSLRAAAGTPFFVKKESFQKTKIPDFCFLNEIPSCELDPWR